eukprot:jgi/Chlat1/1406/Chrsp12S01977
MTPTAGQALLVLLPHAHALPAFAASTNARHRLMKRSFLSGSQRLFAGRRPTTHIAASTITSSRAVCTLAHDRQQADDAPESADAVPLLAPQTSAAAGKPDAELLAGTDVKVARRERRKAFTANEQVPGLLSVPGIGPRNSELLVAKGYESVDALKSLFLEDAGGEKDRMIDYLRSTCKIKFRKHAEAITTYVAGLCKTKVSGGEQRLTFCVEGNISVGKSTFLRRVAQDCIQLQDLVEIVPEPVDQWQNVMGKNHNILQQFYEDPARYAYTFQNYVFFTRAMQNQNTQAGPKPLRLMERSIFSDRMVFVRAVHEAKWMSDMEISIYDSWFDPMISALPGLVPDGFIYLRANPETCHSRMQSRARREENKVDLSYLKDLHEKHEQWLLPVKTPGSLMTICDFPNAPANIKDKTFLLQNESVPALVLDCDQSIDFNKDQDAKEAYASQVRDFFHFVTQLRAQQAMPSMSGQIIHPGSADLQNAYQLMQAKQRFQQRLSLSMRA